MASLSISQLSLPQLDHVKTQLEEVSVKQMIGTAKYERIAMKHRGSTENIFDLLHAKLVSQARPYFFPSTDRFQYAARRKEGLET